MPTLRHFLRSQGFLMDFVLCTDITVEKYCHEIKKYACIEKRYVWRLHCHRKDNCFICFWYSFIIARGDFHQNLLPLLCEFEQINQLLFPLKSSDYEDFLWISKGIEVDEFAQNVFHNGANFGKNPYMFCIKILLFPCLVCLSNQLYFCLY